MKKAHIEKAAIRLASWLHEIRNAGRPCPTNIPATAIKVLNCTKAVAQAVKAELTESGRLVVNPVRKIFSIDGKVFPEGTEGTDPVDSIKTALRTRYHPVFDPRTRARPNRVPSKDGQPTHLVIGTQLVTWEQAQDIAGDIRRRQQAHA